MDETKIWSFSTRFYKIIGRTKSGRYRVQEVRYFFNGSVLEFIPLSYKAAWTESSFLKTFSKTEYNVAPTFVNLSMKKTFPPWRHVL